jgi:type IX secretion system PorP/SprF family membrane protein
MEQNIMKRLLSVSILILIFQLAYAQPIKMIYNQWWLQLPQLNPAASAVADNLNAAIGSRLGKNDFSVDGSLLYARIDGRINAINSGLGFSYFNSNPEALGNRDTLYFMQQRFMFNYNYQFTFANQSVLSAGVAFDIIRNSWNWDWFPPDNSNDPALPPGNGMGNDMNLGFGLHYQAEKLYAGLSFMPAFNLLDQANLIDPQNELYAYLGYRPQLSTLLDLELGLLFNYTDDESSASSNLSANAKLWLLNMFYAGVGFGHFVNSPNNVDILVGIEIYQRLSIHYGYIVMLSELSLANKNQHVISIQYRISAP